MRPIPCNCCGEPREFTEVFADPAKSLRVVRCRSCGLVFVNPTFTLPEHLAYYNTRYWSDFPTDGHGGYASFPPDRVEQWKKRAKAHLDYLSTFCEHLKSNPNVHVLDVGCGYGAHLEEVRARCPQAKLSAVEPNARVYSSLRSRMPDLQVMGKTLETLSGVRMMFDCILLSAVLDHSPDPSTTLKRVYSLLAPRGHCLIVTRNMGTSNHVYDLDHLYYFTEGTLHGLLTHCRLDIARLDLRSEFGLAGNDNIYAVVKKK